MLFVGIRSVRRPATSSWIDGDLVFQASEGCYVYSSITRNSSFSLQASAVTREGMFSEMSEPSAGELSQAEYCVSLFSGPISVTGASQTVTEGSSTAGIG